MAKKVSVSRIQVLDEITRRLGPPAFLRWVDAPYGASAVVVRLRHRGAVLDLKPTGDFRLIFQISPTNVLRDATERKPSQETVRAGTIIASCTECAERIHVIGPAETFQLLFSPELAAARRADLPVSWPPVRRELLASTIQTLVATSPGGTEVELQQTVASIAKLVVEGRNQEETSAGGLAPQARRVLSETLDKRLLGGVPVSELADATNLSLHHFIKVCRQSEGLTPHALLTQKRIDRAIEMLLGGMATINEVAMRVGFFSPSHFISTFRRLVGVTPAALRRAVRS